MASLTSVASSNPDQKERYMFGYTFFTIDNRSIEKRSQAKNNNNNKVRDTPELVIFLFSILNKFTWSKSFRKGHPVKANLGLGVKKPIK